MIWWAAAAFGSPGSAGALHLGAEPFEGGFVGGGALVGWSPGGAAAVPVVEGGAAVSDRVALTAMAGVTTWALVTPGLVSGRYLLVDRDPIRFAITGQLAVLPLYDSPLEIHLDPGLAIDAGGRSVRFDAAMPLWGVSSVGTAFGPERFPVPLLSTIGVSGRVSEHGRLRFGLPELLSWSWRSDRAYLDLGGATVLVTGFFWTKVGAVF